MRSAQPPITDSRARSMLVVIHDCAPVFLHELEEILEQLRPLVGTSLSAAVVPMWKGEAYRGENTRYRDLLLSCDEQILHGWTHQSATSWTPLSLLTDRANEFSGLTEAAILSRIQTAQADFRDVIGASPPGLLPPAWQLPIASHKLCNLEFVMRFSQLERCRDPGQVQSLATWSWDWGHIGCLGYAGEVFGQFQHRRNPSAIPCVAIHPVDLHRGFFSRAVRLIQSLRNQGYQPTTASRLMPLQESPA